MPLTCLMRSSNFFAARSARPGMNYFSPRAKTRTLKVAGRDFEAVFWRRENASL